MTESFTISGPWHPEQRLLVDPQNVFKIVIIGSSTSRKTIKAYDIAEKLQQYYDTIYIVTKKLIRPTFKWQQLVSEESIYTIDNSCKLMIFDNECFPSDDLIRNSSDHKISLIVTANTYNSLSSTLLADMTHLICMPTTSYSFYEQIIKEYLLLPNEDFYKRSIEELIKGLISRLKTTSFIIDMKESSMSSRIMFY